jgi:hypothetical protein
MKLLTILRWLNGIVLLLAFCGWAWIAALQWLGRYLSGAGKVVKNTVVLFGSGFTKSGPSLVEPYVDLWLWLTGGAFVALWLSVFFPRGYAYLHFCAFVASALMAWNIYIWRYSTFAPVTIAVVLLWAVYYWAAAWRA